MEDLADSIKTKSLSNALECLTEQVLEISSLTLKDLEEQPHLRESLQHLSQGIRSTTKQLCEILAKKVKALNPSINNFETFQEMFIAVEEASTYTLWLTLDETSLEAFQEKIAGLLEVLLRLMIFWDQELIKSFKHSISLIKHPLYKMKKTQFLQEIIVCYKEFIIQFGDFSQKLSRRVEDLIDRKIQNEFWIHITCIRKLATSFSQVIRNIASYPLSKHGRVSKEFVVKELLSLLDEISELLSVDEAAEDVRNGTSFLGAIDDVLEQLERSHFDDDDMGWRLNVILQHSMTVSKFSAEEDRLQITRNAQRVLNEYRALQSQLKNLENSPSDISLAVDIFRDFLELLEQSVNHSLLRMMVENLSICTEPIRRLIQQCPIRVNESALERTTADLTRDVEEFDCVMEKVLQTCFFALSSTADLPKIQVIRCALKLLESLEAEMIPAVYSCYLDPANKAAGCHLQFLWRSFREHCEHMQTSLDSIADPIAFCHVAEKVLSIHIAELRSNLYTQNSFLLERHCRPIIAITSRCLSIVEMQEWARTLSDKIFLKEIRLALREFKGAVMLAVGNVSDLSSHRSMLKRAELVLKYLMKSIDTMKQMQDSQVSLHETLRHEIKPALSCMFFPDDVVDLPCDPTKSEKTTSFFLPNSTKIGRLKRRIDNSKHQLVETEHDCTEMTHFVNTTQPWRARNSTAPHKEQLKEEETNLSESFDLTNLLEELSVLEGTLLSSNSTQVSVDATNKMTQQASTTQAVISNLSISTPQRLRDLQIVSERLALLRKQNGNLNS